MRLPASRQQGQRVAGELHAVIGAPHVDLDLVLLLLISCSPTSTLRIGLRPTKFVILPNVQSGIAP